MPPRSSCGGGGLGADAGLVGAQPHTAHKIISSIAIEPAIANLVRAPKSANPAIAAVEHPVGLPGPLRPLPIMKHLCHMPPLPPSPPPCGLSLFSGE
jgi:hypothetical protein